MAALLARALSGSQALVAATAQTVLQLTAAANQRVKVNNLVVALDGATATAVPVRVQLVRQTSAGTFTNAVTPVAIEKELTETIQTAAHATSTAEPTSGDVLWDRTIPAYNGTLIDYPPFGQEYIIPGGGRLGVVLTAPAVVNARVELGFEE